MSAVNLLSCLREKEKPSDDEHQNETNDEGEEECAPSGGGGDPAVLAVGPARKRLTYTRDELMKLRNSPLCKRALDAALRGSEALALVLKKRPDSPNDEDRGGRGDAPNENHKGVYGRERERDRRSADPRERVRKESEPSGVGIVLSPQRRSFTLGCGAPPPPHARARPESPLQAHQPAKPDQGRRIGSGRIMVREGHLPAWEREEGEPYRPPRPDAAARAPGDRFERRSFGRDSYSSDIKREREERFNNEKGGRDREDNRRNGRFNQRRFDKEDEPEWFSGGPTSQHDTIELRGFDETRDKRNNNNNNNNKDEKWSNNNKPSPRSPPPEPQPQPPPSNDKDHATGEKEIEDNNQEKESVVDTKGTEDANNEPADFNLDDFLKFDSIPEVLTNGGGEAEGSRFSRWFRRDSPTHENRHYERLLHNMVDELEATPNDTSKAAPMGETTRQFLPISPALSARPPSLLDLLRRANVHDPNNELQNSAPAGMNGGKIHSLEELEARLRPPAAPARPDHELAAFKRLLAQVSGGHAVPASEQRPQPPLPPQPQPQPPPMSLLQMLNKSMEQQKAPPQPQQPPPQPHIPQELLYKLLQVQRQQQQPPPEMLGGAGAGPGVGVGPGVGAGPGAGAERELLQRPEAQAIIHGLKAGEITVQHLMTQLSNPGLQSRHRELLLTIVRLHHQHRQMGGSPLPVAPPPAPHLVVPPHHQPLRLSPLPHPAFCVSPIMPTSPNTLTLHHPGTGPARIPSPRELAAHTQSIMQGALIKKKLEEQRENYRRRHEAQKQTPISFTPTSVLRKMTADKEEAASPKPQQHQWNQPPKVPQGRPIVKGNQGGGGPPMGYTPTAAEYQQHYLTQQQQMANAIRPFPHPQQRQIPPSQLNNMNKLARGVPSGTTLHQLLVQSHQRTLNEMAGGQVGAGGGDNQLARWFSPELLARASAGKLPSLRVPNALSLEELERGHQSPAVRN